MKGPADDAERLARLRLIRSENVGPITFRELLKYFASAEEALEALPSLAAKGGRKIKVFPKAKAEEEIAQADAIGARHLHMGEPGYPAALAAAEDAPPVLLVIGQLHLLERPAVGVVGARNASTNGRRLAREIAAGIAAGGFAVASGMARGIDAAAHEGALEGGTVAVLAGGPDVVYPEENRGLYEKLVELGAVVTEAPPGLTPQARHFPRRNRIISGLSLGVVVVEAAQRSGSLITARLAGEQGREVMAVPGSPLDPRCRGTNGLIRNGATLVENAEDVLAVVRAMRPEGMSEPDGDEFSGDVGEPVSEDVRERIMEALGPTPAPVDAIVRELGLPPAVVLTALLELELAGRLERQPGNMAALIDAGGDPS
jgi:DNA processing protein